MFSRVERTAPRCQSAIRHGPEPEWSRVEGTSSHTHTHYIKLKADNTSATLVSIFTVSMLHLAFSLAADTTEQNTPEQQVSSEPSFCLTPTPLCVCVYSSLSFSLTHLLCKRICTSLSDVSSERRRLIEPRRCLQRRNHLRRSSKLTSSPSSHNRNTATTNTTTTNSSSVSSVYHVKADELTSQLASRTAAG